MQDWGLSYVFTGDGNIQKEVSIANPQLKCDGSNIYIGSHLRLTDLAISINRPSRQTEGNNKDGEAGDTDRQADRRYIEHPF